MIKTLCLLLSALLILAALPATALAVQSKSTNIVFGGIDSEPYATHMVAASTGDTVYALVQNILNDTCTIERWTDGMDVPEIVISQKTSWNFQKSGIKGFELCRLTKIFSDGGRLYGFDNIHQGIRMLVDENGNEASMELLYTLEEAQTDESEDDNYRELTHLFAMDGVLYLSEQIYLEDGWYFEFSMIDLNTGERLGEINDGTLRSIAPYQDGKLLALFEENSYDKDECDMPPYVLRIYDVASGETERIGEMKRYHDSGIVYNAKNNTVYFSSGSQVYSFQDMKEPYQLSAYLPIDQNEGADVMLLADSLYAYTYENMLVAREVDKAGFENGVLTIVGDASSTEHLAFLRQQPQVDLTMIWETYSDFSEVANAMISGDASLDIISLYAQYVPLDKLFSKGYAADLSVYPEIMQTIGQMNPAITSCLMQGSTLYGVPIHIEGYGIGYSKDTLEELGMTQDDLPGTYLELLDYMADFDAEEYEDINLFDSYGIKPSIFAMIINQYAAEQMRNGDIVHFDTPLFRKLLAAFERIDFSEFDPSEQYGEAMREGDHVDEFYSKKAIFAHSSNFIFPNNFMKSNDTAPMILPLDEGMKPLAIAEMQVMIINSRSSRIDEAAFYLSEYIKNYTALKNYPFFPAYQTLLENKGYQQEIDSITTEIEVHKELLENADPESKATLRQELADLESDLGTSHERKMEVDEQALALYREKVSPYLYITLQTPLNSDTDNTQQTISTLRDQYLGGAIDADTFIRDMDKRIIMMVREDQ